MRQFQGLDSLKYPRKQLIEILRANRDKHVKTYEKSLAVYRQALKAACQELIDKADNDEVPTPRLDVQKPTCNKDEYTRAISMFELTTVDEIELDQRLFDQLVLDNWSWKAELDASFLSNSRYLSQ